MLLKCFDNGTYITEKKVIKKYVFIVDDYTILKVKFMNAYLFLTLHIYPFLFKKSTCTTNPHPCFLRNTNIVEFFLPYLHKILICNKSTMSLSTF